MNTEELITGYLTNENSAQENSMLLEWVISNEANKKEFIQACQIWHNSSLLNTSFDKNKAYKNFTTTISNKKPTKVVSLWKTISAVAAVAILIVGIFFVMHTAKPEMITIANNTQTIKTIVLHDGSQIVLQKGAQVTYPQEFESNARNISTVGTVFCSITPNPKAPFTITNNTLQVQVLGTSFEVNESQVIVESGIVMVSTPTQKQTITKGERVDITNGAIVKSSNNDINYASWKTGILLFNNTALQQVFKDLERHYKCSFTITNPAIVQEKLTGTFENQTIENVIAMINEAFPTISFTKIDSKTYQVQ
jgi:ferric-dicitrate binding protein FerR (iron transport regulator)